MLRDEVVVEPRHMAYLPEHRIDDAELRPHQLLGVETFHQLQGPAPGIAQLRRKPGAVHGCHGRNTDYHLHYAPGSLHRAAAVKIAVVTPAKRGSRSGNRVTATRWARILRQLGHRVQVCTDDPGTTVDLLVAIHAWRSAAAVMAYRARQPGTPLVVLLSGTDIYQFQHSHPGVTLGTMSAADRLVGLHDRVGEDIPSRFRNRLRIIYQSCTPSAAPRRPLRRFFQVCVVGHLREEKDPLRAALAARRLPSSSRLRIVHLGAAMGEAWARAARLEAAENPRYVWRGEVPRWKVRQCLRQSHAMVMNSVMEGGANAVSEAMVAELPVLASDISGNRGLLGETHRAYFPVRDDRALAALLERIEGSDSFRRQLAAEALTRTHRFAPEAELESWRGLLSEL